VVKVQQLLKFIRSKESVQRHFEDEQLQHTSEIPILASILLSIYSCAAERWGRKATPTQTLCQSLMRALCNVQRPLCCPSFTLQLCTSSMGPLHSHSLPFVHALKCPTSSVLPLFCSAAAHQNDGAITLPLTPFCARFDMSNVICAAPLLLCSCAPERWAITLSLTPCCACFEMSNVFCAALHFLCSCAAAKQWGTMGPLHSHSLPLVHALKCPTSSVLPPFSSAAAHQNDGPLHSHSLPLVRALKCPTSSVMPLFYSAALHQQNNGEQWGHYTPTHSLLCVL